MICLTKTAIDPTDFLNSQCDYRAGATVLFLGSARERTAERVTRRLEYDAYNDMAKKTLEQIASEATRLYGLIGCDIVHRLGIVELGETCVLVHVSCPHRDAAFTAAAWIMNQIKQHVPIWKCEHWVDGSQEWVYPQAGTAGGHGT